jgi:tRNA 2-thiouridine synthesizing protein B
VILHTLNASPASAAYKDCLTLLRPGDALVLLGDGVYAAVPGTGASGELAARGIGLYLLDPDARLAGITAPAAGVEVIDMAGLVRLTEQFPRQLAWY